MQRHKGAYSQLKYNDPYLTDLHRLLPRNYWIINDENSQNDIKVYIPVTLINK
jgi:hypothetical protein